MRLSDLCFLCLLLFKLAMHPLFPKASTLTETVIAAAIEVHRDKGAGLIESIYEWCLLKELGLRALACVSQKSVIIEYRNLSKRDPDVVGGTEDGEVHLAEGKLLTRGGQPFEQCLEQSLSLRAFADYLYVFFPWGEWTLLRQDDD